MKQESLEYYRQRARAECEAALNATCPQARKAHAQMARAYEHLLAIAELEDSGKVASFADAQREQME